MTKKYDTGRVQHIRDGLAKIVDYWTNTNTGIGSTTYDRHRNMRQVASVALPDVELETYYVENDIAATVVDRVVLDAMRQGYGVNFEGIGAGQSEEIVRWAESQYKLGSNIVKARQWGRLYGGAGLFIASDNGKELTEPLTPGFKIELLRPYAKPDLDVALWYDDRDDLLTPKFGRPAVFRARARSGGAGYFHTNIHESRFQLFFGIETTTQRFIEQRGWGDSVLMRVIDVLKRFDGSWISIMQLLTDASVPVYKIKELMELLGSGNLDTLMDRLRTIDIQKNNNRPILLDADGESYERVPAQFTEVANILQNAMIRLSAAAQMPVSILFGQAPAGLNATPEGDLRNWYDRVGAERRECLGPALVDVLKLLLAQSDSPTKGKVPDHLEIIWPSLWQSDPVQQATLYQMVATADGIYMANQVLKAEEVAVARAATASTFGFPQGINVELRKEILEQLETPEDLVATPNAPATNGLPDAGKPPSNARPPAATKLPADTEGQ